MDALPRTVFDLVGRTCIAPRSPRWLDRAVYAVAFKVSWRFGSYTSWCFHIESTMAAIRQAPG